MSEVVIPVEGFASRVESGTIRCRLFGHKWRAYALDMPTFKYHCLRCGSRKEKRMPWTAS